MIHEKEKKAFTMIELIMVIIVLGILAAVALPRLGRDLRQSAADNVLSAIRYTQHLALTDNKENPAKGNWQKTLWQIRFEHPTGGWIYKVGANNNGGTNINKNEAAIDPANGKLLFSSDGVMDSDESPNIFLERNFAITDVTFNDCKNGRDKTLDTNTSMHIAFDYLGRPHRGVTKGGSNDSSTVVTNKDCLITFDVQDSSSFAIQVDRETGYAHIVDQNAS